MAIDDEGDVLGSLSDEGLDPAPAEPPDDAPPRGGGRVGRTGIAVVHEGELILPAADSHAQIAAMADDPRRVVRISFPVEVEVVSHPSDEQVARAIGRALGTLDRSIRARRTGDAAT